MILFYMFWDTFICQIINLYHIAGGQGLEPRLTGPKPGVLPLDDPPIYLILYELICQAKL